MKKQNGGCNVRKFRWFLFGMSPNVAPVKSVFLLVTLNFELVSKDLSNTNGHSSLDYVHPFHFYRPTNFERIIFCAWSLFDVCYYVNVQFKP